MTVTKWFYEITESDTFQAQFFDHKQGFEHQPTFTYLGKKQFDSEDELQRTGLSHHSWKQKNAEQEGDDE